MAFPNNNSIVDYLKSTGQNSSSSNRAQLAVQQGIVSNANQYTGSATQNLALLAKLRGGSNAGGGSLAGSISQGNAQAGQTGGNAQAGSGRDYSGYLPSQDESDILLQNLIKQNQKQANRTLDEDRIKRDVEREFQSEIDSINRIYDNLLVRRLDDLQPELDNRTGQSRAIRARGGLLGSARGQSQAVEVENINQRLKSNVSQEVNAERANRISALLGEARQISTARIKEQRELIRQGGEDLINNLALQQERQQEDMSLFVKRLIAEGIDIEELSEAELEQVAKDLGVSSRAIADVYFDATADSRASAASQEIENAVLKQIQGGVTDPLKIANALGGQVSLSSINDVLNNLNPEGKVLGRGSTLIDPRTGRVIAYGQNSSSGSSSSSSTTRTTRGTTTTPTKDLMTFEEFKNDPQAKELIAAREQELQQTLAPSSREAYLREVYESSVQEVEQEQRGSLSNLTASNKRDLANAGLDVSGGDTQAYFLGTEPAFQDFFTREVALGNVGIGASLDEIHNLYTEWTNSKGGGNDEADLFELYSQLGVDVSAFQQ